MKYTKSLFSLLALFTIILHSISAQTAEHPRPTEKANRQIIDCLKITQAAVTDMNNDGKINCIDYAETFKGVWDSRYYSDKCEIVRNYNKNGTFHHLFIRVCDYPDYLTPTWYYVEPHASNISKYLMEENWSYKQYNPAFNIYGETRSWMENVKMNVPRFTTSN